VRLEILVQQYQFIKLLEQTARQRCVSHQHF